MTFRTFPVTGLTCESCAQTVTGALNDLNGVLEVLVDLDADGTTLVTVTSTAPLEAGQVAAALDAAGGFRLAAA